jgi:hypothetical protein
MKRMALSLAFALSIVVGSVLVTSAQETPFLQERAFGIIAKGSTVCVGPISASADGVQLFGFTNGSTNLTWQLLTVSSQSAPAVIFETTGTSVHHIELPQPSNFLFQACVIKRRGAGQDFDITLNSPPTF